MCKVFSIDYERCNGCELCALHCSFIKTGTFNPSRSRVHIHAWEEKGLFVPTMCLHCEEPPCIPSCPEEAISKDSETGVVSIDYDKCIGHLTCIPACPYGALTIDPVENRLIGCDLCGGDPVCVKVCPIGVIQFVETDKLDLDTRRQDMIKLADVLSSLPGRKESGK
jgi:Fe-S-cluster-containing dehydrogenase component